MFNGARGPTRAPYRRPTPEYPSNVCSGKDNSGKKPTPTYTGTYVKGVALLHKQAYAPVTDSKQAEEIAKMRRS